MATSSASARTVPRYTYDVFVSFRGEDIRKSFVDHLFSDFQQKGIHAFRDDELLPRGKEISSQLYKAIESSRILLVIFSKNYASSTWCLRELVKILECEEMESHNHEVRTVYYDVEPSVVRNQTGSYKQAFDNHEALRKKEVAQWKAALTKAADFSGWVLQDLANGFESKFIDKISKDIFDKLIHGPLHVGENLVGIQYRTEQMKLLRFVGPSEVHMIGICGMGGVGKTTLARAVYNLLYVHFESYSFCEDVKGFVKTHGMVQLQKKLIEDIMKTENLRIRSVGEGIRVMKERFASRHVLVVLDDVDDPNQLETLAGSCNWFGPGSLIIVTGRDRQVLNARGVEEIFDVEFLYDDEALELFSLYAFKDRLPKEGFSRLANQVVQYVKGHPLALKVLGCFLFSKSVREWESELSRLRKYPHSEINQVLRLSYDRLDHTQKIIFLDIACFFIWETKNFVAKILDGCDLFADSNIRVLVDRSLITVTNDPEVLNMHDLLRQMAWDAVREKSNNPGEWSRLWFKDDVCDVLKKDKGTEAVEGVSLNLEGQKLQIHGKVFARMGNLRLLKISGDLEFVKGSMWNFSGSLEYLSNELRWLHWHGYPFKFLPSTFYPENLVALDMSYSHLKQLWTGSKSFEKLKFVRLSHCCNITKTPDFTRIRNLEELILEDCINLVEVHPSVGKLPKLLVLNLKSCKNLKNFPSSFESGSLQILNLSDCSKLDKIPEDLGNMTTLVELHVDGTAIEKLPSSIKLTKLLVLNLKSCKNLKDFPGSFESGSLRILNLSGCSKLEKLPEDLGNMKTLVELHVDGTAIEKLPSSMSFLTNLEVLSLGQHEGIQHESSLISWPPSFGRKRHHTLSFELPSLSGLHSLRTLNVSHCKLQEASLDVIGSLSLLEVLDLSVNDFSSISSSFTQLSRLWSLRLVGCRNLQALPELPRGLAKIDADDCTLLREFPKPSSLSNGEDLMFRFGGCLKLDENKPLEVFAHWLSEETCDTSRQSFSMLVPGSRIPEWFSNRSMGDCVTADLPPDWRYKKFKGLAFCAFLHRISCTSAPPFTLRLSFARDTRIHLISFEYIEPYFGGEPRLVESDHIWLGYYPSEHFSSDLFFFSDIAKNSIEVSFEISRLGKEVKEFVVKECGMRLVCEEVRQEEGSNSSMIQWFAPPPPEDDGDRVFCPNLGVESGDIEDEPALKKWRTG